MHGARYGLGSCPKVVHMNDELFNELLASVQQADDIQQ